MARARKVKSAAIVVAVPQNRDETASFIKALGDAQRERERLETELNQKLGDLKMQYELLAQPHALNISKLKQGIQIWCEANRVALTDEGKRKTAQLASGEVRWRTTPPAVSLRGVEEIIAALKAAELSRFIRTKEEVNKEAILGEQDAVAEISGITIGQHEEFVIVPFETQLEEVA